MSARQSCLLVRSSLAGKARRNSDSHWAGEAEQMRLGELCPLLSLACSPNSESSVAWGFGEHTYGQPVVLLLFFFFLPSFLIQTHFYDSRQLSLWKLPCNTHWSVALPGDETQRWVADSGFIFHLAFLEDSFWFLWGNGWQTQMRRKEKLCLFYDKVFIP